MRNLFELLICFHHNSSVLLFFQFFPLLFRLKKYLYENGSCNLSLKEWLFSYKNQGWNFFEKEITLPKKFNKNIGWTTSAR